MKSQRGGRSWLCVLSVALILILNGCVTPQPKLAPPPGVYNCPQTVTITDANFGASVYYTTDGSTPTISSIKYTGPFAISSSDKVQAIAQAPGEKISQSATVNYTCTFSRADFAQMIQQRFSLPAPQHPLFFPDVQPNDPDYAAIEASAPYMNAQVFCPGCVLNRNFSPNQPVTRAISTIAVVRILTVQANLQLLSAAESNRILSQSPDGRQLPPLARPYFATAISQGMISFLPGNTLGVSTPSTRDEITAVLDRLQAQFNFRNVAKQPR